jgi:hypothetical protein
MSDKDLVTIGFTAGNDGVLSAPRDSRVRLAPIGQSYELRISLGDGHAVLPASPEIKICRCEP